MLITPRIILAFQVKVKGGMWDSYKSLIKRRSGSAVRDPGQRILAKKPVRGQRIPDSGSRSYFTFVGVGVIEGRGLVLYEAQIASLALMMLMIEGSSPATARTVAKILAARSQ